MRSLWRTIAISFASAGALSAQALEPPVVLTIEIDNAVLYRDNTFDITRIAKSQTPMTSSNITFRPGINIGDIVTLNGRTARGNYSNTFVAMPYRANPTPGQPIADVNGTATFHCTWHVLAPDGTYVGTLHDSGASPSPEHVVVGGTGAFFGITGVHNGGDQIVPWRFASTEEDPALRRIHGGGKSRYMFHLYPRFRPQVRMTPAGPAVYHGADFSPVTAASPARSGEIVIVAVTNLGPTQPELLPPGSRPFKGDPLEVVNSPVEVTVNGKEADVINKVGWPGMYDLYRVDFRLPSGLPPGRATIQLTVAWISGAGVEIPVQ